MKDILKMIIDKCTISKSIIYTVIGVLFIALYDCPYKEKVVVTIIKCLFSSYEMFSFVNIAMSYLTIVLWIITFAKFAVYIFPNVTNESSRQLQKERKIKYDHMANITVYISSFKWFTFFLYNYNTDFSSIIFMLGVSIITILSIFVIIYCIYKYVDDNRTN